MKTLDIRIERGVDYDTALGWQQGAVRRLKKNPGAQQALFLVEHKPVLTLGRSGDGSALIASPELLAQKGIEYHESRRGGDITYHGPGQWTIYPVLRLEDFCKDLHRYMRMLEEMVIRFLAGYGIEGGRNSERTGVWVGREKISAVGIAVSNWISFHGAAVNIQPDLSVFRELIVPCGITAAEGGVTSIFERTGVRQDMDAAAHNLIDAFFEVFPFERQQ